MKRIILFISIFILIIPLAGCQEKKEIHVSEQHYRYGLKAIEIADKYLDYEISASEATELLENLISREDELLEREFLDPDWSSNNQVEFYTRFIKSAILLSELNSSEEYYSEVIERRNVIASAIGIEERKTQ